MNSSPLQDNSIEQLIAKLEISLNNLRAAIDKKYNADIDFRLLDTRTRNILIKNHRIRDYLALSRCEVQSILKWRNCGRKTIENIIKIMDEFSNSEIDVANMAETAVTVTHNNYYCLVLKIEELIDGKKYLDYKPMEEEIDKFGKCATCIAEYMIGYIEAVKRNDSRERDIEIFADYIADDKITLESIGRKYDLTRERIRQLVLRSRKSLCRYFYKDEYKVYGNAVNDCLANIPYKAFMHFVAFGLLTQCGERFTLFTLQCLLGDDYTENVFAIATNLISVCPPAIKIDRKIEELLQKACFPNTSFARVNIGETESEEYNGNYAYLEKFYGRLTRYQKLKKVIFKPKIVYYVTSTTEHVPDFGLITEEGKLILVIVLPTINMALRYNLKRFNALHKFCKEKGYGYIITNDRFNTINDIKNGEIDGELVKALLRVLDKYDYIGWNDIQRLKSKFKITNATLAAFILQNKLDFSLSPFLITYPTDIVMKNSTEDIPKISYVSSQVYLPECNDVSSNKRKAEKGIEYLTVKVGKYNFICDENGEILTDSELFEELREFRRKTAEEEGFPNYCVFGNAQLIEMATYKPTTEGEWLAIKGLGPAKFGKYGERVIEIIQKYKNK